MKDKSKAKVVSKFVESICGRLDHAKDKPAKDKSSRDLFCKNVKEFCEAYRKTSAEHLRDDARNLFFGKFPKNQDIDLSELFVFAGVALEVIQCLWDNDDSCSCVAASDCESSCESSEDWFVENVRDFCELYFVTSEEFQKAVRKNFSDLIDEFHDKDKLFLFASVGLESIQFLTLFNGIRGSKIDVRIKGLV